MVLHEAEVGQLLQVLLPDKQAQEVLLAQTKTIGHKQSPSLAPIRTPRQGAVTGKMGVPVIQVALSRKSLVAMAVWAEKGATAVLLN